MVRLGVAAHSNTTPEVLTKLKEDENIFVSFVATERLEYSEEQKKI